MASRQNLLTLFWWMFSRDIKLINIPSHFNVFDLETMRFNRFLILRFVYGFVTLCGMWISIIAIKSFSEKRVMWIWPKAVNLFFQIMWSHGRIINNVHFNWIQWTLSSAKCSFFPTSNFRHCMIIVLINYSLLLCK